MNEIKHLKFSEKQLVKGMHDDFKLKAAEFNSKSRTSLKGKVIFRDAETGKVLLEKDNEIVLRG